MIFWQHLFLTLKVFIVIYRAYKSQKQHNYFVKRGSTNYRNFLARIQYLTKTQTYVFFKSSIKLLRSYRQTGEENEIRHHDPRFLTEGGKNFTEIWRFFPPLKFDKTFYLGKSCFTCACLTMKGYRFSRKWNILRHYRPFWQRLTNYIPSVYAVTFIL